jgi:dTDP-glucose 4,6-dehydratase
VTGGAGFIGRHVVLDLLNRGWRVVVFDARTRAATSWNHLSAILPTGDLVRGDVLDYVAFCDLLASREPDVVYHLAAESHVDVSLVEADYTMRVNGEGTMRVARACATVTGTPMVYVSTDEVYGDVVGRPFASSPHDALAPSSPYSASKAAGEHAVHACARSYGLRYAIVRPCNAWGENQLHEKLVPRLAQTAANGGTVELHDGGVQVRQWVNVCELATAIVETGLRLRVSEVPSGATINLGGPVRASVLDLAGRFAAVSRSEVTLASGNVSRPGQDFAYWIDVEQAHTVLGWSAKRSILDPHEIETLVAHYGQDARATHAHAETPAKQDAGRALVVDADVVECVAIARRSRGGQGRARGASAEASPST